MLPDLPCDPKMLIPPLDRHELSKFKLTQMELAFRPDLISGMEPGNLPLIDVQRFTVPQGQQELDPEDRAICEGNKSRGTAGNVSWLVKTRLVIPVHTLILQSIDGTLMSNHDSTWAQFSSVAHVLVVRPCRFSLLAGTRPIAVTLSFCIRVRFTCLRKSLQAGDASASGSQSRQVCCKP